MNDCTQLSDRMPAVARGSAPWNSTEQAHLSTCRDCSREWDLVRRTGALARSMQALDAERVAAGVLAGLRVPAPSCSRVTRAARWMVPLALAAGLVLFLIRPEPGEPPAGAETQMLTLLPEAEALSEAELESVIRLIPDGTPSEPGVVDSLTEEELNQILKDMEG